MASFASGLENATTRDVFVVLVLIGTALFSFGLGRVSVLAPRPPVVITMATSSDVYLSPAADISGEGSVNQTASAAGAGAAITGTRTTRSYYFSWCSGVNRIKEKNRVYFNSKEEAENAGYHPASSCVK